MSVSLYNGNNTIFFGDGSYQSDLPIATGQSWSSPTRAYDTLYTNSTTRTIIVAITVSHTDVVGAGSVDVDGVTLGRIGVLNASNAVGGANKYGAHFFVKPGSTYKLSSISGVAVPSIWDWAELK
jgi:hypothetical protein